MNFLFFSVQFLTNSWYHSNRTIVQKCSNLGAWCSVRAAGRRLDPPCVERDPHVLWGGWSHNSPGRCGAGHDKRLWWQGAGSAAKSRG